MHAISRIALLLLLWDYTGPSQFAVYRSVNGGGFELIGTTTATQYDDRTVTQGRTYCYNVTASDATQESVPSNTVCVSCVMTKGKPPRKVVCQ